MRNYRILLMLGMLGGAQLFAMEVEVNDALSPTPKEKINAFLQAKNQGRAGLRALATPRSYPATKIVTPSDFRKIESSIYEKQVVPAIMQQELTLKANTSLYIDEPLPSTLLLTGADGMRPALLAKILAKIVDADYQEILHWRAKGTLDLMKGFAVTGEEKRDKVLLIRDIALLGRDEQGAKEQSHMLLYDKLASSMKALQQRRHQIDHRVYVIAATAYEEALAQNVKSFFEKTYQLAIPDQETAAAIVGNFMSSINGSVEPLDVKDVSSLCNLTFDELNELVKEATKCAVSEGSETVTVEHIEKVLPKIKEAHDKAAQQRADLAKILLKDASLGAAEKATDDLSQHFVLEQVPVSLRPLYEHSVDAKPLGKDVQVYLLAGESGLGKTMAARILAERRGADLVVLQAEDLFEPIVGKTQKNVEAFFAGIKEQEKKGKKSVVLIKNIERLIPAAKIGDEDADMVSLRRRFIGCLNDLEAQTLLLLAVDDVLDKVAKELAVTVGKERCVLFEKPHNAEVRKALLVSLARRLCVQTEESFDYENLAQKTTEFTCADLEKLVRSAIRKAMAEHAVSVQKEHYEAALSEVQHFVDERSAVKTPAGMYC